MQLTVVVENQTSSQNLLAEWGYSAWLQTEDAVILLDTGGIQHTLQHNLTALGLNARRITDLVLSHGHFDHTSGVMDVLRLAPHARVWAARHRTRAPWRRRRETSFRRRFDARRTCLFTDRSIR